VEGAARQLALVVPGSSHWLRPCSELVVKSKILKLGLYFTVGKYVTDIFNSFYRNYVTLKIFELPPNYNFALVVSSA
jgi:hypothetical protein